MTFWPYSKPSAGRSPAAYPDGGLFLYLVEGEFIP